MHNTGPQAGPSSAPHPTTLPLALLLGRHAVLHRITDAARAHRICTALRLAGRHYCPREYGTWDGEAPGEQAPAPPPNPPLTLPGRQVVALEQGGLTLESLILTRDCSLATVLLLLAQGSLP